MRVNLCHTELEAAASMLPKEDWSSRDTAMRKFWICRTTKLTAGNTKKESSCSILWPTTRKISLAKTHKSSVFLVPFQSLRSKSLLRNAFANASAVSALERVGVSLQLYFVLDDGQSFPLVKNKFAIHLLLLTSSITSQTSASSSWARAARHLSRQSGRLWAITFAGARPQMASQMAPVALQFESQVSGARDDHQLVGPCPTFGHRSFVKICRLVVPQRLSRNR